MRGIFGLKTQKTGPGLAVIAIPKPIFSGFTVFWAISALKARKLPDLSGRQIRQGKLLRMGVTSFRGDLKFLAHDDDRGLQSVQLYDLGVSGSTAEIFLSNVPQGIALINGVSDAKLLEEKKKVTPSTGAPVRKCGSF